MILRHLPEAAQEIYHLVEYYFGQEESLAADFDKELRKAEENIVDFPDFWSPVSGGYRRYLMKRFPYSVIYFVEDDVLLVVAVAGHKQEEGYWRKRSRR